MPTFHRTLEADGFLPDDLGEAIRRRLREIVGIALIAGAALTAAALATWSIKDPSLSYATSAQVHNILGRPGAIAADLLTQLFGLASIAWILPWAIGGWRLLNHRRFDRERLRFGAWILGALLAAAFAACLPKTAAWPLPTGLGGVVGDALLRLPASLYGGRLTGLSIFGLGLVLATTSITVIGIACGYGLRPRTNELIEDDEDEFAEADDEEGASISLGWLVHTFMSLKARFTRAFMSLLRAITAPAKSKRAQRTRIEPRLDGTRARQADGDDEDNDEDEGDEEDDDSDDEDEEDDEEDGDDEEDDEDDDEDDSAAAKRSRRKPAPAVKRRSAEGYELPSLAVLAAPKSNERSAPSEQVIKENAVSLESVLEDFGVRGEIINAHPGPVVTLYELEPAPGIKSSRVIGLADDIARSMSAVSARVAVVAGRNAIGIELPNPSREKVYLREMLASEDYNKSTAKLPLCLGKTIGGDPVIVDLTRMPHLLIAGTTGSGKSVAINTMILSLLYRLRPDQCRLVMVDPKMLELSVYDSIPHLLTPVVTDPKKAVVALKWAVREMEERYKRMSKLGVRNIDGYNARLAEAKSRGETLSRTVHTGYDRETGEAVYETEEFELEPLPYVVVVVDEMADLMMVAGKDIEGAIQRLAQMARAAGIHVILATQRPSVDVITGTIKANFPTRISFQVTSKIDSRTILGEQGAEQLLGQGDMLYMAGGGRISRVHGPFVSDEEVEKVVRHLKTQGAPHYLEAVTADDGENGEQPTVFDATSMGAAEGGGDLYGQAVQIVMRDRKASTSYIQRRLQIGYNRAASIMERMEQEGVVGRPNHAGKREILVGGDDKDDGY
jgi:DNA segregation ATPase FtsK/SpoIIIE, S-DNA-T family